MKRVVLDTLICLTVPNSLSHFGWRKMMLQPKRLIHCIKYCKFRKTSDLKCSVRCRICLEDGLPHMMNGISLQCERRHSSTSAKQPVINPLTRLQSFVAIPIIPKDEVLFDPSTEELSAGEKLFIPTHKHKISFLKGAVYTDQLPQTDLPEVAFVSRSNVGKSSLIRNILGEVAFVGRSNVGKSSLIRNILGEVDVRVDISKKPGRTRTLNFYQVGNALSLVDMPGYGFNMPQHFADSVEEFLKSRRRLLRTFILIDAAEGINSNDRIGLDMLEEFMIPYVIVLTKIDKVPQSRLLKNFMTVLKFREEANTCFYQPFLTSASSGDGIALLKTFIGYVTGNVKIKGL